MLLDEGEKENEKAGLKLNIWKTKIMAIWSHHSMANRWGKIANSGKFYFLVSKVTVDSDCSHEIKTLAPWKKRYDKYRQHIKKHRHHFANKGLYSQSYGFSSSHVWMWELDHKEGWTLKNWCFWTVLLEDSWELLGQQGDQTSQS